MLFKVFVRIWVQGIKRKWEEGHYWLEEQKDSMSESDRIWFEDEYKKRKIPLLNAYGAWLFHLHHWFVGRKIRQVVYFSLFASLFLIHLDKSFAIWTILGVMAYMSWWAISGAKLFFTVGIINHEIGEKIVEELWSKKGQAEQVSESMVPEQDADKFGPTFEANP